MVQEPVTRRVAQYGTREIAYNVTRMVAHQTTRKVAVNTVRMVAEEVTAMQPVTVMRTIPTGTTIAYAGSPYGIPAATALSPSPDRISAQGSSTTRSAERTDIQPYKRDATNLPANAPLKDAHGSTDIPGEDSIVPASFEKPLPNEALYRPAPAAGSAPLQVQAARPVPTIVRVAQWTPRAETTALPSLVGPTVAMADRTP
jgi:hypothetical protein